MAMVSAGRILIIPRGAWDNATTYKMLDLVTASNNTAYLCKSDNVNVNPINDTTMTYWQPFGSVINVDGETIIQDANGYISANIDGTSIFYDQNDAVLHVALSSLTDVDVTALSDGKVLAWDNTAQKWKAVAISSSFAGLTDVSLTNLQNGQVPKYNSTTQKWENASDAGGLVPHLIIISETGSVVTATKGTTVITAVETSTGHFECDVPSFGTWVIDAVLSGDDAQVSVNVDTVKIYTIDDSHFHADITVTYPTGAQVSCSKTGETTQYATGSPYTFTVHSAGTWTITSTYNGVTVTEDVVITTSGQTESVNMVSKTITVDLYSAAADTVSFTDETGAKTATTDSSGLASGVSIALDRYSTNNITFASSVAKDPSNLSVDFSKTVTIGANTTSIYLMPNENVLYWYGYQNNFGELSSGNGWSGGTFVSPTFNTNNCETGTTSSGVSSGFGTINSVTATSIHSIVSSSASGTGQCNLDSSKDLSSSSHLIQSNGVSSANTIQHLSGSGSSSTGYMQTRVAGASSPKITLYAMWYE